MTVTATNGVAPDAVQHVTFVFATTKTTMTLSVSTTTGTPSGAIPVAWMGQPVTLTAKVSPVPNGGTVSLESGGGQGSFSPCGPILPVNTATGIATCTTTFPADGWGIDGTYSGYGVFAPSASNGVALNVLRPGFWLATADGHVYGYEAACYKGQPGHQVGPCPDGVVATSPATGPVVGITGTPDGKGYWVATANGGVSAFGDAKSYGDLPALGKHVTDVVAITATPDGKGYYLVGADGGFFTFGDAKFRGSLPGIGVHTKHIVGMVAAPTGTGYLLVGWDGGVFTFGDAHFYGSLPGLGIHVKNIRDAILSYTGTGYALGGADGGVFIFGTGVKFYGSLPGIHVRVDDIVGIALTPGDKGYWMPSAEEQGVFGFGDANDTYYSGIGSEKAPVAAIAGAAPIL